MQNCLSQFLSRSLLTEAISLKLSKRTLPTQLILRKYSPGSGFFKTFGMFTTKFSVGAAFKEPRQPVSRSSALRLPQLHCHIIGTSHLM
ncbi:hypothetical protein Y032_0167g138 [Ancylostoma ceylanicum]|uniref:Uncharacterized protein n=1 Tax=Ancylostoma ceylanicum TaxID=53326 RepID=A0A016SWD7_9BILA|nr:hypothetical protein Y032_0167g138 [Ancylostoma ceylanicum]